MNLSNFCTMIFEHRERYKRSLKIEADEFKQIFAQ